jgi:TolA-binding protein
MKCDKSTDAAERYVSGTLPEAEQTAFEEHFFACDDCLHAVQALQDAAAALAEERVDRPAATPIPFPVAKPRALPIKWMALAAMLIVGVIVWRIPQGQPEGGQPVQPGRQSSSPPSSPAAPPAAPSATPATTAPAPATGPSAADRLVQLSQVVAPPYVSLTTRSDADATAQAFDAAMTHYSARQYDRAARALREVVQAAPELAEAQFFLGVAELMRGDQARAQEALRRAVRSNTAPYADEAHFYLAKAALKDGDAATARRELQLAIEREAGPRGEASRLLSQLKAIER